MKQVTRCYNCKNITRIAGSFKAEIKEVPEVNGMQFPDMALTKKIVLCRDCARKAGYKVSYGIDRSTKMLQSETHDPSNQFTNIKSKIKA